MKLFILAAASALLCSCGYNDSFAVSGSYASGSFANAYYGGSPMYYGASGYYYNGAYCNQPYYYVPSSGICVAYINNCYRPVSCNYRPRAYYPPPPPKYYGHSGPGRNDYRYASNGSSHKPPHSNNGGAAPRRGHDYNSSNPGHSRDSDRGSRGGNARPDVSRSGPMYVNNSPARNSGGGIGSRPDSSAMSSGAPSRPSGGFSGNGGGGGSRSFSSGGGGSGRSGGHSGRR